MPISCSFFFNNFAFINSKTHYVHIHYQINWLYQQVLTRLFKLYNTINQVFIANITYLKCSNNTSNHSLL